MPTQNPAVVRELAPRTTACSLAGPGESGPSRNVAVAPTVVASELNWIRLPADMTNSALRFVPDGWFVFEQKDGANHTVTLAEKTANAFNIQIDPALWCNRKVVFGQHGQYEVYVKVSIYCQSPADYYCFHACSAFVFCALC